MWHILSSKIEGTWRDFCEQKTQEKYDKSNNSDFTLSKKMYIDVKL